MAYKLSLFKASDLTSEVASTNADDKGQATVAITGLAAETKVKDGDYIVETVDLDSKLANSDTVPVPGFTVLAPELTVPDAPSVELTAGDSKIDYVITPGASDGAPDNGKNDVTGYTVVYAFNGANAKTQDTTELTGTIDGLTNDTEYTVRVVAHNPAGDSAPSADVKATPKAADPK